MAIHVTDKETDAAVRRLAALTGETLTDAIRKAVEERINTLQAGHSADREERFRRMMELARAHQDAPLNPRYATLSHKELTDIIWDEEGDL